MKETFPITVTAQMRHGVLWEARAIAGTSDALAKLLDLRPQMIGKWINFKAYPSKNWWNERGVEIEGKLSELLNRPVTYNDLFPAEIRTEAFQEVKKRQEVTHEVPFEQLTGLPDRLALPPAQTEFDLKEAVSVTLDTLRPRERSVLEMRFGLSGGSEMTLDEVAEELGVTRERIRQIEAKALRRLRHPSKSKLLRPNRGYPTLKRRGARERAQ